MAGAVAALVFIASSPYILLDWPAFRHDIGTLLGSYNGQHGDVVGAWPVLAYRNFLWSQGLGPVGAILLLVAASILLRRKPAEAVVVLAFPLLLLIVLLRAPTHFFRNLLPLQPPLLLLAGYGAIQLWDALRLRWVRQLPAGFVPVAIVFVLLPSAAGAVGESAKFAQSDARVAAQRWSRSAWPGTRIAGELQHPITEGGVAQTTTFLNLAAHPLAWYREHGYGLLLLSSEARRRWEMALPYQSLIADGKLLSRWGGPRSGYRGPRLDLIDTGLTAPTLRVQPLEATFGPVLLHGVRYGPRIEGAAGPEVGANHVAKCGSVLGITAFWERTVETVPAMDYITFVQLRDANDHTVAQRDASPWGGLFPLSSWPRGRVVGEALDLPLPTQLKAGSYRLVLGIYDRTTGRRLGVQQASGPVLNNELDLGGVTVQG